MSDSDGDPPNKATFEPGKFVLTGQPVQLKVQGPLPAEHPYYALIGRVASAWTNFEHVLDLIIWDISGISRNLAICITGQMMGCTPRFKAIEALGLYVGLSKSNFASLRKLKASQYEVAEERNRIVHDPWFVTLDTDDGEKIGEVSQLKISGFKPIEADDVEEVIRRINKLIATAHKIRAEILDAVHALRGKRK